MHPKGPKQRNSSKQLQTHNLSTDNVKNIDSTNKGKIYYSLTICRLFFEEHKGCRKGSRVRVTLHISTHTKWEQDQTGKKIKLWPGLTTKRHMIWFLKLYNKLPENIQSLWSHKLYRQNHENLGSWIDCRRKKLSWSKDQKRYIYRRCHTIVTIHNCYDTT